MLFAVILIILLGGSSGLIIQDQNVVYNFNDYYPSVGITRDEFPGFQLIYTPENISEITPDGLIVQNYTLTNFNYGFSQVQTTFGYQLINRGGFNLQWTFQIDDNTYCCRSRLSPSFQLNGWNFLSSNNSLAIYFSVKVNQNSMNSNKYVMWTKNNCLSDDCSFMLKSIIGQYEVGITCWQGISEIYSYNVWTYGSFNFDVPNGFTFVIPNTVTGWPNGFSSQPCEIIPNYDYQPPAPTPEHDWWDQPPPTPMPQEKVSIISLGMTASFLFLLMLTLIVWYYDESCGYALLILLIIGVVITSFVLLLVYLVPY